MTEPTKNESGGFQMSGRRTAVELGVLVCGLVGAVALVIWGAGALAGRLVSWVPVEVDRAIGEQAWNAMDSTKRCTHDAPQKYVEEIAQPLIDALEDDRFEFRFAVFQDDSINAFALPGGFVTVHTGLLESAETGGEVAAVLAHEIHHVTRRHGTKRVLRQVGGMAVLYAIFGGTDLSVPASMLSDLVHTAYDRDQETEADRMGQDLMISAGLHPGAMARFFERLAATSVRPPEIVSTHPDPGNRAELAKAAGKGITPTRTLRAPTGLTCMK